MVFYEIEMLSVPSIMFACDVETPHYKNSFLHKKDFLEISCAHSGLRLEHTDAPAEIAYPQTVIVLSDDLCCHTSSYGEDLQRHTTVGVKMKYSLKKHSGHNCDIQSLKDRLQRGNIILLPHLRPMGDVFEKVVRLIRRIIISRGAGTESSEVHALSHWFSLTAFLTDYVLHSISKDTAALPPSEYVFAAKASQYIAEHINQKITVSQIAAHLKVSEGYLHRIFRNSKGCSIVSYINERRVWMVKEMVQNKNLSLKAAAKSVGIEDTAYMSRLFKKVTGRSFREYYKEIR